MNTALIIAGIWGSVGFVTVILSAALKGISTEILEAARVDGATEGQIFRRIIVPMLSLPISVVAVTLVINVIKLFDLIYTMTQGGPANASRVIAFSMYQEALPATKLRLWRGDRRDHADHPHPGDDLQRAPLPGREGDPMTARFSATAVLAPPRTPGRTAHAHAWTRRRSISRSG